MAYTYITWAALRASLALRLADSNNIYWTDAELVLYLSESLRAYGLLSGFWRARGVVNITANTVFYDINSLLSGNLLTFSVTDRDIIKRLQYDLLESTAATTSQSAWFGTEMFTYQDLANAVQNRANQFMSDTGIVVNRSVVPVAAPPIGRQQLTDTVIDVRRAAWLGASPVAYYNPLWREDERSLTAADQSWSVTGGTPESYSVMAPPPLQIQLAPPPNVSGQIELLTVDAVTLDPANTATVLGIPDDLTPAIRWGALSDLLGIDGIARDPIRAAFAEERYQQYVQLARLLPVVLHAEINGVPLIPCTLQELESSTPTWQNISGRPYDIALAAPNLIALNPVPDTTYSVTLDVVRRTPIPVADNSYVQIGREQLDTILDYAEHLALFKVGGVEWHSTEKQANDFLLQSLTYNQRLAASARDVFSAADQSQQQNYEIPRRSNRSGFGAGALKLVPRA